MSQGNLVPIRIVAHNKARGGGKDAMLEGVAEDGTEWLLKRLDDAPLLPATEYIAYRLAAACRIATPLGEPLHDIDGRMCFGSRIEGGLEPFDQINTDAQYEALISAAQHICAALALDLFMGNEDRHWKNFLWRRRGSGGWTCFAIDWSRSWWRTAVASWPPNDLIGRGCSTNTTIELMSAYGHWKRESALMCLGNLSGVTTEMLAEWVAEMPPEWLPLPMQKRLLAWWKSGDKSARLSGIIQHCKSL